MIYCKIIVDITFLIYISTSFFFLFGHAKDNFRIIKEVEESKLKVTSDIVDFLLYIYIYIYIGERSLIIDIIFDRDGCI